jgi:RNA polymerase sigma-54 factor
MCATLTLQTRQNLTLTPKLQASLRLLQLSSIELQQELRDAIDSNPFLEEVPTGEGDASAPGGKHGDDDVRLSASEDMEYDASAEAIEPVAQRDSAFSFEDNDATPYRGDASGSDAIALARTQPTLREHLHEALGLSQLDRRGREAARIVIDALDDDGYLRQDLSDLVAVSPGTPDLKEAELRVALRLVQTLDEPGIGARSLSECLRLQLDAMPGDTRAREVAATIVDSHLELLARREMASLQKHLGCDAQTLHDACSLVRKLDPRPGDAYGRTSDDYIVPDVIVYRERGRWRVAINPAVRPRARIHRLYSQLLARTNGEGHTPLAQQLQEARWLLRNVHKRFDTIQRVSECIVAQQHAFFQYGEVALKPLVLRNIADELGLHESTVSRATANKYIATPHGTFALKHFFPRELETETGGTCSSAAVRALLKQFIDAENVHDPLSDVTLARLLAEQGVLVARRTVTKYRNLMRVPPAELRRRD